MPTVDVVLRYSGQPSEAAIFALGSLRDVYGIRRVSFARAEKTLTVEFDATRLNTATVEQLVRRTGLCVEEIVPQLAPQVAAVPAA